MTNEFTNEIYIYLLVGGLALLFVVLVFFLLSYRRDTIELGKDMAMILKEREELRENFKNISVQKELLSQKAARFEVELENANEQFAMAQNELIRMREILKEKENAQSALERERTELSLELGNKKTLVLSLSDQLEREISHTASLSEKNAQQNSQISELLTERERLDATLREKINLLNEQRANFDESKAALKQEFEALAGKILEQKTQVFSQNSQNSLSLILEPLKEQIKSFEKRVNEVNEQSIKDSTSLKDQLANVVQMGLKISDEAQNLATALKGNNKSLGNWGEMQLETTLQASGLEPNIHYVAQKSERNESGGRNLPDIIIKLPENKSIVIDAKSSLVDYERAINNDDRLVYEAAMKAHVGSLRSHFNDLAGKNYPDLMGLNAPEFTLMFVPIEAAYIEALKFDTKLFNDAYKKNVIIVSHTTLMPILRVVAQLWRIEHGNVEAREIVAEAGKIYAKICIVAEKVDALGKTLTTANKHYNDVVSSMAGNGGLFSGVRKLEKFSDRRASSLPQELSLGFDSGKISSYIEKEQG